MANILTAFVTYEPDLETFTRNLQAVYSQDPNVIVYDNGSSNADGLAARMAAFPQAVLVRNGANEGLPINYNRAARYGQEHGFDWLLLFDQDSFVPQGMLAALARYTDTDADVICPRFWDVNLEPEGAPPPPAEEVTQVADCISSGSLNRIRAILDCGGFDERMFIDQVDYDWCRNLRRHGGKILQVNGCCFDHAIGRSRYVTLLGRRYVVGNHSAFRKYYFFRNMVYQIRKWGLTRRTDSRANWPKVVKFLVLILYEDDRRAKYAAALRGIRDGLKMQIVPPGDRAG